MAGNELGMADQVWSPDRFGSKAQVRDGHCAGFLGVVVEVSLGIIVGLFANDLDGVLICSNSTIRTQAKEQAAHGRVSSSMEKFLSIIKGGVGHIIIDANSKVILGFGILEARQRLL